MWDGVKFLFFILENLKIMFKNWEVGGLRYRYRYKYIIWNCRGKNIIGIRYKNWKWLFLGKEKYGLCEGFVFVINL